MSASTINKYLKICRYVFKMLLPDLGFGITENPFYHIRCGELKQIDREVFTPAELKLIFSDPPPLMRAIFTIGLCTGLREGDVATLKWEEVDGYSTQCLDTSGYREIHRVTNKTEALVHIPITEELSDCLQWLWKERHITGEFQSYVIPEAAKIYLEDAPLLSYRIRVFLEGLGIKTRKLNSNGRNQSIKFLGKRRIFQKVRQN